MLAVSAAALAALVLAAGSVEGHSWMSTPVTRNGNTDETTSPCDTGAQTARIRINRGEALPVNWGGTHSQPIPHEFRLFPAASESDGGTGAITDVSYPQEATGATVPVPAGAAMGNYFLQYKWGNYYNCADIVVLDASMGEMQNGRVRLNGDKGFYTVATGEYQCDDEGMEPYEDPDNEGVMTCGGEGVAGAFPVAAAFGLTMILLCVVGLLCFGIAMVVMRSTNNEKYTELSGRFGVWNGA